MVAPTLELARGVARAVTLHPAPVLMLQLALALLFQPAQRNLTRESLLLPSRASLAPPRPVPTSRQAVRHRRLLVMGTARPSISSVVVLHSPAPSVVPRVLHARLRTATTLNASKPWPTMTISHVRAGLAGLP
jgi:hypothetical protein